MNSDPGTSGLLSPFADINGLYFDGQDEPNDFFFNLTNRLREKYKEKGDIYINCEFDNPKDYYNALYAMKKFTDENISVYGTSREGLYDIVIMDKSDMDDTTKPVYKSTEVKRISINQ